MQQLDVLQSSRSAIAFPRSDMAIPESLAITSGKFNLLEWTGPLGLHSKRDWAISPSSLTMTRELKSLLGELLGEWWKIAVNALTCGMLIPVIVFSTSE